jgi:NhaB family Na+:H+ antiporter
VLQASPHAQLSLFYLFNGLLSSISDNVFVGTVYINEAKTALDKALSACRSLSCWRWRSIPAPTCRRSRRQTARRFPVPADLRPGAAHTTFLWPHGVDGAALHLVLTLVGLLCVEIHLDACHALAADTAGSCAAAALNRPVSAAVR